MRLFERNKRRVLVTPAGEIVANGARQILGLVNDVLEEVATHQTPLTGELHLGAIPTIAPYLLPRVTPLIRKKYPEFDLAICEDFEGALVDRATKGDVDLLSTTADSQLDRLEVLELFEDPFVGLVPHNHRLSRRKTLTVEDLRGENVLLLTKSHCLRRQAESLSRAVGACEPLSSTAQSLSTLVQMVQNGMGVTLLPQMALYEEVRGKKALLAKPFEAPAPSRTICLAWRKSSPHREAFREIGRIIASVYE